MTATRDSPACQCAYRGFQLLRLKNVAGDCPEYDRDVDNVLTGVYTADKATQSTRFTGDRMHDIRPLKLCTCAASLQRFCNLPCSTSLGQCMQQSFTAWGQHFMFTTVIRYCTSALHGGSSLRACHLHFWQILRRDRGFNRPTQSLHTVS
jgi:hypothetical protein